MTDFINLYKNIRKVQKKPDGVFTTYLSRPVSPVFTYLAYKLKVSANVISLLSFLACLISSIILFILDSPNKYYISGGLWWLGAILDSSDGELARFTGKDSKFGAWLDSFLDRLKEFMIFSIITYIVYKNSFNDIHLILGLLSIFSNVISGYITDTKRAFIGKRSLEIQFSKQFAFQMVDTRDFLVTIAIISNNLVILLWVYGTLFVAAVIIQFLMFIYKYNRN